MMMGNASIGLALACAAMIALTCLPMAAGMIRRRRRRRHTDTHAAAVPADRQTTTLAPSTPNS